MSIFKWFHIHYFTKLIVSRYWTFDDRQTVRECRCGKREIFKEDFSTQVYPHETATMITQKELELYLTQTPMRDTIEYKLHHLDL